ncbi:MAG: hypothetical protein EHM61_13245 [Acidobacteria bacterium]|nr:MAG: hypothetical protein EHM61_13245 [Acidobacteriota bacterium]
MGRFGSGGAQPPTGPPAGVIRVAASGGYSLALLADGTVWVWEYL